MKSKIWAADRRKSVSITFKKPSRTRQEFAKDSDINHIMQKYRNNGTLPQLIKRNPQFGDFSNVPDYQEALNTVQRAHEQFEGLSAETRDRFRNSPQAFLEFASDPRNAKELVRLGLAIATPIKAPEASKRGNSAPKNQDPGSKPGKPGSESGSQQA